MKKMHLPHIGQHVHLDRMSAWSGWLLFACFVLGLGIIGWKNYGTWVKTLTQHEVPSEVLSQKQERIKLKELETVQKAWEEKQQLAPTPEKTIQVFSNGS